MQIQDIKSKIDLFSTEIVEIKKDLKIQEKKLELISLEAKAGDPNFWDDQEKAKEVMQKMGDFKKEIETLESLEKDILAISELAVDDSLLDGLSQEIEKISAKIQNFKLTTFLAGRYDRKNAILSIHAGQGGVEAMDWASMLFRMYYRYCEKKDWKVEVLDETPGEEAGIKSVVFKASGMYAYGYLKGEAGTHRLVRQSPFNADRLRQTSFALVEVLPEFEDVDLPDINLKEDDLEWQFFRSSSQGGQNVQKVSTAVRLRHKPTGFVVTAQTERFQEQNRKIALNLLRSKLWAKQQEEAQKTKKDLKGDYHPATWGTQIRSYVLHPYKMIKDLRTEVETSNVESVLDGDLDNFIEAEIKKTNH